MATHKHACICMGPEIYTEGILALPAGFKVIKDVNPGKPPYDKYCYTLNEKIHQEVQQLEPCLRDQHGFDTKSGNYLGLISYKAKKINVPMTTPLSIKLQKDLQSIEGKVNAKITQTKERILTWISLIAEMVKSESDSINWEFIFFYVGHGKQGSGALEMPDGTELEPSTFFAQIKQQFEEKSNMRMTVIVDACFSGHWVKQFRDIAWNERFPIAVQSSTNENEYAYCLSFVPHFVKLCHFVKDAALQVPFPSTLQHPEYAISAAYKEFSEQSIAFIGTEKT